MEILSYTLKWSEAILRWGHVLFAILWVGNSFLFKKYESNKQLKQRRHVKLRRYVSQHEGQTLIHI